MNIKIVFYKSSSKYYDSVCLRCENFENFTQEKSVNTLEIGESDIRQRCLEVKSILETVRHWTKTEYFIDGKKATISDVDGVFLLLRVRMNATPVSLQKNIAMKVPGGDVSFLA